MAKKPTPAALLSEKLVQTLEAQCLLGGASYPLTLRRLAELADPAAPTDLVEKAAGTRPFKDRAIWSIKKSLPAPVFFLEDLSQVVAAGRFLELVLEAICTPEVPAWALSKLKTRLVTPLKVPFEEGVRQQIRESRLPESVGWSQARTTLSLWLKRMPPPPPPEVQLAERLVRVLEEQRERGDAAYPVSLRRLLELAASNAPVVLVKAALAKEPFRGQGVVALSKNPESPVALASDHQLLAGSPQLLEATLRQARKTAEHGFTLAELKKNVVPALQPSFLNEVQRQAETGTLPATVGGLLKKNWLFFLVSDLAGARPSSPPVSPDGSWVASVPFVQAFAQAFDRLDQQRGSPNFVSLVDLRRAVPATRDVFDAELRQLRLAGRYYLSGAEGRHGISPEEREAGIMEEGRLLLFVSRKTP